MSPRNLISLILQVTICASVQLAAFYYLSIQEWFKPLPPGVEEVVICWENTVLFTVSCFQYLILAVVYSKGRPYREPLISNFWLLFTSLVLTCFVTYLVVHPAEEVADFFEILYLIHHTKDQRVFRYKLLIFPLSHLLISIFIEVCNLYLYRKKTTKFVLILGLCIR